MSIDNYCRYLEWDFEFFSRRIAKISVNRLTQDSVGKIMEWCKQNNIDCLYFRADISDASTTELAEDNNFRFVDIRVTLSRKSVHVPTQIDSIPGIVIRPFIKNDVPILKSIASSLFRDTRFYYDKNFPQSLCDLLYETWIEKSCSGYADTVLVADIEEKPVSFISCHLIDNNNGQIGLVGVTSDYQGQKVGRQILNSSIKWFHDNCREQVTVATQGRNFTGLRLYQNCGFSIQRVEIWYHKWFQ